MGDRRNASMPMICFSVNFDLFMSGPLPGPDSSISWMSYRGGRALLQRSDNALTMRFCCGRTNGA